MFVSVSSVSALKEVLSFFQIRLLCQLDVGQHQSYLPMQYTFTASSLCEDQRQLASVSASDRYGSSGADTVMTQRLMEEIMT